MDFSTAYAAIQGSVVNVLGLDTIGNILSSGSGVIIGQGNLVLTCAHCIDPNAKTVVRFSGQNVGQNANILFQNTQIDIALLGFPMPIGHAAILKSSNNLLIGQEAFVAGFPMRIDKLTALSANVAGFEQSGNGRLIRIDASVNHGNSGGPLFNIAGEVIGIVNAKHGRLSTFLEQIQQARPGASISLGGIDPVEVIQQLLSTA